MIKFEKSQYPIDTENRHQGWVKLESGLFLEGTITDDTFRYLPTLGEAVEIDLTGAEASNVREEWDALNAHNEKMQNWIDEE